MVGKQEKESETTLFSTTKKGCIPLLAIGHRRKSILKHKQQIKISEFQLRNSTLNLAKIVLTLAYTLEKERIITLNVPESVRTKKYVEAFNLPETVQVRLLKFKLENGEEEVLLTSAL
jgi:hypothetical protein